MTIATDSPYGAETASHESWQEAPTDVDEAQMDEDPSVYQEETVNPRRAQATIVMILGTVVFLLSLVVLAGNLTEGPLRDLFAFWRFATWVWVFFGVLVLLLVWILILLATTPARQEEEWFGDEVERGEVEESEEGIPLAQPGDPGAPDTISLRCPKCMNIFSLQDPGERPFHHECPHCEVRGVYSGP